MPDRLLPGLQSLMVKECQSQSAPSSSRLAAMDTSSSSSPSSPRRMARPSESDHSTLGVGPNPKSPRHRISSSSIHTLLNDNDPAQANRTPKRKERAPSRSHPYSHSRERTSSPDETPRAQDVSRFESNPPAPRNPRPMLGLSPPQPLPSSLGSSLPSVSSYSSRRTSDPVSETGSAASSTSLTSGNSTDFLGRPLSAASSESSHSRHSEHHTRQLDRGYRAPPPPPLNLSRDHYSHYQPISMSATPTATTPTSAHLYSYPPMHPHPHSYPHPQHTHQAQSGGSSRAPISRITKACNACRTRKVRCDAGGRETMMAGTEMPCGRCKDAGIPCIYSAQQRKRGPTPGSRRVSTQIPKMGEDGSGMDLPGQRDLEMRLGTGHRGSVHGGMGLRTISSEDVYGQQGRRDSRPAPYPGSAVPMTSPGRGSGYPPGMGGAGKPQSYFMLDPSLAPLSDTQSPLWSAGFSSSSAATTPVTPYHPSYGHGPGYPQPAPIITPPLSKGELEHGSPNPSIMGWNGMHGGAGGGGGAGGASAATSAPPSAGHIGGFAPRSSAEEEAFKTGYTMAFAQFQRQKDRERELEREHERERQAVWDKEKERERESGRDRSREMSDPAKISPKEREGAAFASMMEERRLPPILAAVGHTMDR